MKYLQLLFLVMLLGSCSVKKAEGLEGLDPAAKDIYNEIMIAEKQKDKSRGKDECGYADVERVVNLSLIGSTGGYGDWTGYHYNVSQQDILRWKDWFEKDKYYLSYDPDTARYKDFLFTGEKIIVLQLPDGTITKSKHKAELEYLERTYQLIQNNKNINK